MAAIACVDRTVAVLAEALALEDDPPEARALAEGTALPVLAVVAWTAAILGEVGLAAAPPASPPLAAMAATVTAGALRAMVNRNVDVRFSNRVRYKVNFRPGTSSACSTTTRHYLAMIVSLRRRLPAGRPRQWACGRRRGFKATARLRYVTHHARGVLCTATMPEVRRFDRQNCQESPMK